jgi:eukaryotic-like serine/threonine-protein kinase
MAAPPGWDAAVLDRIARELALFIGPVARVLVQRTAPAAADEVDLYQRLAAHVPTDRERASFLQNQPRPEPPDESG